MEQQRLEKFEERRTALKKMTEEELKVRFWELCDKVVEPMVDLSRTHTSTSIERSVLARMGIDSFTGAAVVRKCVEAGLLGKGAGQVVLKISQKFNKDIRGAAKLIAEDSGVLTGLFK